MLTMCHTVYVLAGTGTIVQMADVFGGFQYQTTVFGFLPSIPDQYLAAPSFCLG